MVVPAETELDSLEDYEDTVTWLNELLAAKQPMDLSELDQYITHLIASLDIECEDTSSALENVIDDVSRGVPRLAYDLHFMKDGAASLQNTLFHVHHRAHSVIPESTGLALERLRVLDTMKTRMEATREVLREAESWSTLELEVTALLSEKIYAKAAARLSEASRSMVIFQNTPEYDPRRTLMVNLQNQLEASLSSALVAAINAQDLTTCRNYFSIFSDIQRESEFRSYYNGSRKALLVKMWQDTELSDCEPGSDSTQTFVEFLPKFYTAFTAVLNTERTSIPSIFPDPALTLSTLIIAILSSLQPTFSQRLSSLVNHYGGSALKELIAVFRATEEFAANTHKIMEKIRYSAIFPPDDSDSADVLQRTPPSHARRRSMRLSMSWRTTSQKSFSGNSSITKTAAMADGLEWDTELFQPFLEFQSNYGALERNLLEEAFREILTNDAQQTAVEVDQARLLRERAVDIFGVAEESVSRCIAFTHGFGALVLVEALDAFFKSFIDMWTADITMISVSSSVVPDGAEDDLSGLDYSDQDWSEYQKSVHLLAAARAVSEKLVSFELKLRSNLSQIANQFRMAQVDPSSFSIAPSRGENYLLEQSPLNSAQLQLLWDRIEAEPGKEAFLPSTVTSRHTQPSQSRLDPLLHDSQISIFLFAKACQVSLQETILSPLKRHLALYSSSALWIKSGDPKTRITMSSNDLQVPSFSISPSDIVQRVAEGLLNLPRLFEVYADDDALSFSLHTLPHVSEIFGNPHESSNEALGPAHVRHSSITALKPSPTPVDHEFVSSTWLTSLGQSLLRHLTESTLPRIPILTPLGAAQLSSDLGYLSNFVRAQFGEFADLETWRELAEMDDDEGKKRAKTGDSSDLIFEHMARLRGWS